MLHIRKWGHGQLVQVLVHASNRLAKPQHHIQVAHIAGMATATPICRCVVAPVRMSQTVPHTLSRMGSRVLVR
jgi:hypothetical protein